MALAVSTAAAAATTTTATTIATQQHPTGGSAALSITAVVIIIISSVITLVVLTALLWRPVLEWWGRRKRPDTAEGRSMVARSAFARGDYWKVTRMAKKAKSDGATSTHLLITESYARIGADAPAADTISDAVQTLITEKVDADEIIAGLSATERRNFREWLDRLKGTKTGEARTWIDDLLSKLAPQTTENPQKTSSYGTDLDDLKQRVRVEAGSEERKAGWFYWSNLVGGTFAAGLAAATGALGVAKSTNTNLIAALAFLSALLMAALTTIKPAEREGSPSQGCRPR